MIICIALGIDEFYFLEANAFVPNKDALDMVMSMGFTKEQATKALKATNNNLERAADWVFSHSSELDTIDMEVDAQPAEPSYRDGSGRELRLINCFVRLTGL